jgi:hypothetical protein
MSAVTTAVVGSAIIGGYSSNRAAKKQADAARDAAGIQAQAGSDQIALQREAIAAQEAAVGRSREILQPLSGIGARAAQESQFLANPQAQFDFLQSNPLFNLALENANKQTKNIAAAQGRLSSGDTLQQLSNNVLLQSQPLINAQRQDVNNLLSAGIGIDQTRANTELGLGTNTANLLSGIGDTTSSIGAAQAAGVMGAGNARAGALGQGIDTAGGLLSMGRLVQGFGGGAGGGAGIGSLGGGQINQGLGTGGGGAGLLNMGSMGFQGVT